MTPYHYTQNNPLNRIDPDGNSDFWTMYAGITAAIAVISSEISSSRIGQEIKQRVTQRTVTTKNTIGSGARTLPAPEKVVVDGAMIAGSAANIVSSSTEGHVGVGKSMGKIKVGNQQVGFATGAEIGTSGGSANLSGGVPAAGGGVTIDQSGNISGGITAGGENVSFGGSTSNTVGVDIPITPDGTVYIGGSVDIDAVKQAITNLQNTVNQISESYNSINQKEEEKDK